MTEWKKNRCVVELPATITVSETDLVWAVRAALDEGKLYDVLKGRDKSKAIGRIQVKAYSRFTASLRRFDSK